MQTAGLVLDIYDAPSAFKTLFKSVDEVPEVVKTAHWLSSEEREALPDDVFALVLMSGDDRLRKFACTDPGNTALNIALLVKNSHKLPTEAVKTAAENLIRACGWYEIEVPEELQKLALVGALTTAVMAPSLIKGTHSHIKDNLAAVRAGGSSIVTPHEQRELGPMLKGAEIAGTSLQPHQDPGDLSSAGKRKPGMSDTSAMKSAGAGHLVRGHGGEQGVSLDTTEGVEGEQYQAAPQAKVLSLKPHVGVLNKEPPRLLVEKQAEHYAYQGVFPLDSYTQVQEASSYFDLNVRAMAPDMRHEFAVNLVKRASAIGIPYSEIATAYGSEKFAPASSIRAALDTRRDFLTEKQAQVLDELYEQHPVLGPDKFCEVLAEFDKLAEVDWRYDSAVLDPYASTYGMAKTADEGDSWVSGNDYVTKQQISDYAITAPVTLSDDYGDDFLKEFRKDPWGVFSSLPLEQKRRLARAAGDNSPTGMHDVR